ncbi:hypothetical protein [uncultured Holdemanella sp.]|uniref:hypothetical protein n=1 Tax=uncultured Holdemanella sp. TaxID=1763549 RepID=UPI002659698E|nr:hypothetical protein [uncultured Holdemanella sp.]
MSDQFVLQAQKYLNNTYQNNNQWVMLTENGNTGTAMMEGLVRAFQLQKWSTECNRLFRSLYSSGNEKSANNL